MIKLYRDKVSGDIGYKVETTDKVVLCVGLNLIRHVPLLDLEEVSRDEFIDYIHDIMEEHILFSKDCGFTVTITVEAI